MKMLLVGVGGACAGAVVGVVLCFGIALAVQMIAPADTPPDFYVPVGLGVGIPAGALAALAWVRRRSR
ncbi:MAG TPA: hypothetical protein VG318_15730 [Actinomycetota bacterium]|nr:hypothetical protein [Actinomycetota bacterium]